MERNVIVSPEGAGKAKRLNGAESWKNAKWESRRIPKKQQLSAGMVMRDLGFVYVSGDPLICAQFTRSTSSIFTNK